MLRLTPIFLLILLSQSIACQCPNQCHPFFPCPLRLQPPQCSSHDFFSLSPSCIANVWVAGLWQPRPPPHTDRSVTVSHDQPDFYEPQHCINHLVVSFARCLHVSFNPSFVSFLLCKVLETWTPPSLLHFPLPTYITAVWSKHTTVIKRRVRHTDPTLWRRVGSSCGENPTRD